VKIIRGRTGDRGQNFGLEARIEAKCVTSMLRTRPMPNFWRRGRRRGRKFQAEAEVNATRLRPTLRPKCWPRGQTFGEEAKVEAIVLTLRPCTRPSHNLGPQSKADVKRLRQRLRPVLRGRGRR